MGLQDGFVKQNRGLGVERLDHHRAIDEVIDAAYVLIVLPGRSIGGIWHHTCGGQNQIVQSLAHLVKLHNQRLRQISARLDVEIVQVGIQVA
jgi:hypothetical protein